MKERSVMLIFRFLLFKIELSIWARLIRRVSCDEALIHWIYRLLKTNYLQMNEIVGAYFLLNGKEVPLSHFSELVKPAEYGIYEVIRIIDGIPLFCEDHFQRMQNSLGEMSSSVFKNYDVFAGQIRRLCEVNCLLIGNVRINVSLDFNTIEMHFIPHHYPTDEEYRQGVKTGLFQAERPNPHIKANLANLKSAVSKYLTDNNLYEVFYKNENSLITEGSRSNVFFVRGNQIFTCDPEKVLLGITREKVLGCIRNLGIELIEKAVHADNLGDFDSVFLTGTSPRILPVSAIDAYLFSTANTLVQSLMAEYDTFIADYIARHK